MIQKYVDRFMARKDTLADILRKAHPSYWGLVRSVVSVIRDEKEYGDLDPARVHRIDDGEYQGTLVFVIGASGYQPRRYWCVKVSYGSCSCCDTLQTIRGNVDEAPTEGQVKDYLSLALHIVQGLKEM